MTDLDDLCRAAATEFVQSAVVIDDEAGQPVDDTVSVPTPLVAPSLGATTPDHASAEATRRQPHPLRTKALVETFAGLGVICGVLQPGETSGPDPVDVVLTQAVARADVVILDWRLNHDNGVRALGYIRRILDEDDRRLRLVAIYTGESDLAAIAQRVATELRAPYSSATPFVVESGATRLSVFAKPVARDQGAEEARILTEEELPAQLVTEFARANRGLVPAATMQALAAMRRNAHRMLSALGAGLDVGFLGHRMLLPDPEDAEEQLLGLIVSELESIVLDDVATRAAAGWPGVSAWLASNVADHADAAPTRAELARCMREGWMLAKGNAPRLQTYSKKTVTDALSGTEAGMLSGRDFAVRMTWKTPYERPPKRLTFGCLLCDATPRYWLCVQPACDALRLSGATPFPLLPCEQVDADAYHLVIEDQGVERRLTIQRKPRRLRMVGFMPDPRHRCVVAVDGELFRSEAEGDFRLVGRLKPDMVQMEAHAMGHAFSRPGIDAPEFLRVRQPPGRV